MIIDIRVHDIRDQFGDLAAGQNPTTIVRKDPIPKGETWWVVNSTVDANNTALDWIKVEKGDVVRVPMFSYTLREQTAEVLLKFGMQFSALIIAAGRLQTESQPKKMLVNLSNVFDTPEGQEPGYIVYAGIAFLA